MDVTETKKYESSIIFENINLDEKNSKKKKISKASSEHADNNRKFYIF